MSVRVIATAKPTRSGASVRLYTRHRGKKQSQNGPRVEKALRAAVYERYDHRCTRCRSTADLTIDHDVPRAKGGTNAMDNLKTLCAACNFWKADKLL